MFASPRLNRLMRLTQTISLDKAQKGIKEALETLLLSERKVVEKEGLSSGREYRCIGTNSNTILFKLQ